MARNVAIDLLRLQDSLEFALVHRRKAHELASWKSLWAAHTVEEGWKAISAALASERVKLCLHTGVQNHETTRLDFEPDHPTLLETRQGFIAGRS